MSKRVYILKHATPKMKYIHMNHMMEFRAALKEHQQQDNTSAPIICKVCGVNEVETSPMRDGECYDCYRTSMQMKHTARDFTASLWDEPAEDTTASECREIQKWMSDHWDEIPEIEF